VSGVFNTDTSGAFKPNARLDQHMTDSNPSFTAHAVIGSLLILDAVVFGFAPAGPWGSESFSIGIIGLAGLGFWYVAWYRFTFGRKGLIPWIDRWQDPVGSSRKVLATGIATLALSWVAGNPAQPHLPDPTGLVLMLIGLLISLSGIYAMLASGPLADVSEESE